MSLPSPLSPLHGLHRVFGVDGVGYISDVGREVVPGWFDDTCEKVTKALT